MSANNTANPLNGSQSDKRLKMIEVILTLGGFLGVIVGLEQTLLIPVAKTTFSLLIVLFIIFAFFAYSAISIPLEKKATKLFLGGLSATFAALLTIALAIPLATNSAGLITLTLPYIGVWGSVILYLVVVFGLTYGIYYALTKAINQSFKRMEPQA